MRKVDRWQSLSEKASRRMIENLVMLEIVLKSKFQPKSRQRPPALLVLVVVVSRCSSAGV
jgi:hypothetical protein